MEKLKKLFKENKEVIAYIFFGVSYEAATALSWFTAVTFSFITSKKYVFESNRKGADTLKEAGAFYSGRVFSGVVNLIGMKLFIDWIGINEFISKAILSIVVLVLNYLLSKFLVFKKKS